MTSLAFGATFVAAVGVVAASPSLPCPARPHGRGQIALDDQEQGEAVQLRQAGEKVPLSAAARHRWIEIAPSK